MIKRIHINQLQPGMYVVGLDKSWWQTPFLSHKWTVRGPEDIAKLREAGVSAVDIDPTRGGDAEIIVPLVIASPAIAADTMEPTAQLGSSTPRETLPAPLPVTLQPFLAGITEAMPAARTARTAALAILEGILEGMKVGRPIDSPAIKHAVSGLLLTILHHPEASFVLTQMQQFEADLLAHSVDVCVLSLIIGKQQGLPREQLETLGVGAILHDVGKTRLPRNLLRKSGDYSLQAQKLLNEHPRLGVSLLSHSKDFGAEIFRIIIEHHERADGSGFPEGRTAADLSPLSHLVSIVNLYDNFVSGRHGLVAHLPTQALRRLYKMGQTGQLLSEQVTWAIRALGVYPLGAVVELNTGERGIVVATKANESLKPTVFVVCDSTGQLLAAPRLIDLLTPAADEPVRMITRPLEAQAVPFSLAHYFQSET